MDSKIGVKCGKCNGQIYFYTCPIHHWVLSSVCLDCGETHEVDIKCKECSFPLEEK